MRTVLLLLLTVLLPGIWGWGVYWLFRRVWPVRVASVSHGDFPSRAPVDYQI